MRALSAALVCMAAVACAAQTDVSDPLVRSAQDALADIAVLARTEAPGAGFDEPLAALRAALQELGVAAGTGATGTATATPRKPDDRRAPPRRPSPADLDQRQRELAGQLGAGPTPDEQRWRGTVNAALRDLEGALAGKPLDHASVAAAGERLRATLELRPRPD